MDKNLITILKDLKRIQPDAKYTEQSKMLILSSPQNQNNLQPTTYNLQSIINWFDLKHSLMATGAIAALIFAISLTVSYLPGNKNSLIAEANEINALIQIKLDEINYHLNNQHIDYSVINNIQNLLKTTADNLIEAQEELKSDSNEIKIVVEKIREAENTIVEINKLLITN